MTAKNTQQRPPTADTTVVAVFDNADDAERAIEALRQAGYSNLELALVTRHSQAGEAIPNEAAGDNAVKDAAIGAGIGGVSGAALAFLGAGTALAIPGIGPVLLALGGLAAGASAGGWIGSVLGIKVPEDVARRYADLARQGHLILFVRPFQGDQDRVESLLKQAGANDVQRYAYTFDVSTVNQLAGSSPATQPGPEMESAEPPEANLR